MKRTLAITAALSALWAGAALAQDAACVDCRKALAVEMIQCHQAAKTDAERAACDKKGGDKKKTCDEGVCKGVASAAPEKAAEPAPKPAPK